MQKGDIVIVGGEDAISKHTGMVRVIGPHAGFVDIVKLSDEFPDGDDDRVPLPAIDGPAGEVTFRSVQGATLTYFASQDGAIGNRINGEDQGTIDSI
eukprot:gene8334-23982_t